MICQSGPTITTGSILLSPMLIGVTSITSGASAIVQEETAVNQVNTVTTQFAQAVKTYWEIGTILPRDYNGGVVQARFYWKADTASANSARWGCQARAYADAAAIDQAFGVAQEVLDANNGNGVLNESAQSAAITIAGAPAPGRWAQFRIYRDGANDTLLALAKLLGVEIAYSKVF